MRRMQKLIGFLLLLVGLAVFLAPDVYTLYFNRQSQQIISGFDEQYGVDSDFDADSAEKDVTFHNLYDQFQIYNQKIYEEKQTGLADAWSYEQPPFDTDELDGDLFGYIEIPAMEVMLPLYLGATAEHLAKGAAVLGQTSVPIGGTNTNSVIAGHRGYQGAPYFREIEKLQIGDQVNITNPFGTLNYIVTEIKVINPDDLNSILIQEGKDMVTLLTCHPYRSHGKYRYAVYCERSGAVNTDEEVLDEPEPSETSASDEVEFVSSQNDIRAERLFRICGATAIFIFLGIAVMPASRKRKDKLIGR